SWGKWATPPAYRGMWATSPRWRASQGRLLGVSGAFCPTRLLRCSQRVSERGRQSGARYTRTLGAGCAAPVGGGPVAPGEPAGKAVAAELPLQLPSAAGPARPLASPELVRPPAPPAPAAPAAP